VSTTPGGYASVQLNGSGSYDPEGSPLTYSWTWATGAATGVQPTVQLPAGVHAVDLIVYDGSLYSNPDTVLITVVEVVNQAPVANAGPDRTVTATAGGYASVQLNGSGSYDPEGSPLTYAWTWTVGPQPYSATGVSPTVQLPVGVHVITLIVHDGSLYSTPDTVQITVLQPTNQAPIANAGPDRTVTATGGGYASVQLNGSGSYDPEGSPLTYSWTWTIGAQTYSATGVGPTVQLPVGTHIVTLVVHDGSLFSAPDTVQIVVQAANQPPVANAGPDRTVTATAGGYASVQLNGSGSYDPEGSPLTYGWTWTIGAQTYSATGVGPTVQLPVGTHSVRLIVFDGSLYSNPDTVQIVVQAVNQAPVANAGPDRTVTATGGGYASVQMNGSGSYDPEGSPLTYSWTWTIGAQTYSATGVGPTIQLPVGTHSVRLIVFDGSLYSNPDTAQIVVQAANQAPIANAGPDQTVTATAGGNASVQLNGSSSYDPEGSPLTYSWTWTIGSQSYSSTVVSPTVQLPVGTHTIRLVVYDGSVYSNQDTVQITVLQPANQAPVANAGPDRTVYATAGGYASVQLDGSGSYDPEGSPLAYTWIWTVGSQSYYTTTANPTLQLPVGTYSIRLTVFDGSLYSTPDYVQITVLQIVNQAPIANAGPDRTGTALVGGYASIQLDGSASYDPDGGPLTYTWTWTIGPQSFSATGVSPTVQLPVGTHNIQLIVFDGSLYSNPDTVQVTILQTGGQPPVANAGADRTVSALGDGFASVQLDGSGSYDPDGGPLQYTWTWTLGAQTHQSIGVQPTVQLPVGVHTIELVVFDGTYTSAPDYVVIHVVSPQEYPTWVWPFDVNRGDTDEYVVVLLTLPTIPVADVDLTVPIACYPGGVQAVAQHATEHTDEQGLITMVFALFEEEDLFDAIPQDGLVEVTVVGRLLSGDWFSGTAQVALTH